jgi:hypothetical protein
LPSLTGFAFALLLFVTQSMTSCSSSSVPLFFLQPSRKGICFCSCYFLSLNQDVMQFFVGAAAFLVVHPERDLLLFFVTFCHSIKTSCSSSSVPLLFLLSSRRDLPLFLLLLSSVSDVISTEDAHSFIVSIAAEKSAVAFALASVAVMPLLILLSF